MSPTIWAILLSGLSTSTIITMSSHHWLLAWLGLELNTLSILPIITKPHHPRATEAATKYFLMQATAAGLILFSGTMNTWQTGQWLITHQLNPIPATTLTAAIMLKLGLAPAHAWLPEVLQGSTMSTALIISTWQKLAPLTFLYLTLQHLPTMTLLCIGLLSAIMGGLMGLNQTQTRKIMAFSSIAHMGWLITALTTNLSLTTLMLLTYLLLTSTMFLTLITTTAKSIMDLGTSWSHSPTLQTMTLITLMSMGGMPPLTGFMPKLLILKELVSSNLVPLATTLILASLPSLFFYTRMTYLTTLTSPPNTTNNNHQWRLKMNTPHLMPLLMTMSTMLMIIFPLLNSF
uniref:NADH-ubiquinone oxidoreductase chain 2 n=1 Tax=Asaccus elisae TaxID=886392 RepID=E2FZ39_9SAUR|nr:NADH dehydrogenase subunit 2 [Asaccus elisae]ADN30009.1 NADH dehydrogenase subunit 2 [Asaccus elisae]